MKNTLLSTLQVFNEINCNNSKCILFPSSGRSPLFSLVYVLSNLAFLNIPQSPLLPLTVMCRNLQLHTITRTFRTTCAFMVPYIYTCYCFCLECTFYFLPLLCLLGTYFFKTTLMPLLIMKFPLDPLTPHRFIIPACDFPSVPCLCFSHGSVDTFLVCLPHNFQRIVILHQCFSRVLRQHGVLLYLSWDCPSSLSSRSEKHNGRSLCFKPL